MHRKTFQQLFTHFQTRESGLSKGEVQTRLRKYGPNAIQAKGRVPLWIQFLAEFKDLMVIILIAAVIISFAVGEVRDATIILFIVILNAVIGFIQKFKAEKALEALQKMVSPQAKVLREGKVVEIEAREIVPGDILILNEGDRIPADARLFEENELEIEEAALTGESIPVAKQADPIDKEDLHLDEHHNLVFMGTTVCHGTAKGVVFRTGMETEFGKIAHLTTSTRKDKSPLEKELFKVGIFVGKVTIFISALLFLIGYFGQGKGFSETFLFAVAVAVAAVPEGLPATITIALALGVQRLAKKNAIVKQLSSVETLGSTTVICSDKTGTLTKNEMTVQKIWTRKHQFSVRGGGYKPEGHLRLEGTNTRIGNHAKGAATHDLELLAKRHPALFDTVELLCRTAVLCNNASLAEEKGRWKMVGDPTEGALLTVAAKAGFDLEKLSKNYKRIQELPFDSKRKMMTTINKAKATRKMLAYVKGAPDSVIHHCSHILINGKVKPLTKKDRDLILKENDQMAKKALRVIALAYRDLPPIARDKYNKEGVEKNLVFIGMVGMIDPPRKGVKEAVAETHLAGIKTYIVTGDNGLTAEAIARQIGLVKEKKVRIVTGTELDQMNEKRLATEIKKHPEIIFSRVSPEHKLKIVTAFKHHGEIVAVTGDGVNDAPALKKADIGIAMGISGTDVSREAANMVLADDSFATIVIAIKEGRTIYNNLKKFVFYIFSCNIGELVTVFAAILLSLPYPLTAILILCIDLGTDVLPALALGIDPPEPSIMQKPPRDPKVHILRKEFILRFLATGLFIGAVVTSVYIWQLMQAGWTWGEFLANDALIYLKASTIAFALLVLIQMIQAFNSRSAKLSLFKIGIFSNRKLLGAVVISIITLILFVEVPWIADNIHTVHLTIREWIIIILASLSVLVFEEVRKLIFRPREKKAK